MGSGLPLFPGQHGVQFPDPDQADPDGLVCVGGQLSIGTLLSAYTQGVFPWTDDPVTWWSPDPRGIFELHQFHIPRSFRRFLRRHPFRITVNQAFRQVIQGCAKSRPGRLETWISPSFIEAYTRLHEAGHAHSVECWAHDRLVGGIYGVSVGGLFAGESMFQEVDGASKVALVTLAALLKSSGYELFDIQMVTSITQSFGAIQIPRSTYLSRLRRAVQRPVELLSEPPSPSPVSG